ncbi:MAG: hypothetical protein Q8Q08_05280 [Candidatus Omnitrophota bacterium]|nr:hypothetical protein [Candidatus Omnitrophota bacterium]
MFSLAMKGVLFLMFFMVSGSAETSQTYVSLIQSKNFFEAERQLTELENSKLKNADGNYVFYQTIREISKDLALDPDASLPALNTWCGQSSHLYLPFLIRGRFYKDFAWADRGTTFADKVLPEAWPVFKERLALAKKDLSEAAGLNPQSAEPWVALMAVDLGLGDYENLEKSFNEAVKLDKDHYGSYYVMLQSKMEKWGGSNEEMFEFARSAYRKGDGNPAFGFLLLEAHDEMASRRKSATDGKKQDYYQRPEIYEEMRGIVDAILKEYSQSVRALNWSAKIDYFAGKYAEALRQLELLEDAVDEDVWKRDFVMKTKAWLNSQRAMGKF